jgi:hypothetical protein
MFIKGLILVLMGVAAFATSYPPDYSMKGSCQISGPVKVCRSLQTSMNAVLDIYYSGNLKNSSQLYAFVQANYNNSRPYGTFLMSNSSGTDAFVRLTSGCLVASGYNCLQYGTRQMRDILVYAQRPYMAVLNALSLEVAIVNGNGVWDNFGYKNNYKFYFPEM